VTRGANRAAEDARQNIKANTPDARALSRGANRAAEDATDNTKAAGKNLVDSAKQAIQDTSGFVQEKVNQATNTTQRNVDRTGNAINDAID
jgi:gas vesicle protein